jgi:hypothetical protein
MLSYYLLCFLFNKIGEEEDRAGSAWNQGRLGEVERGGEQGGEMALTMYAYMNK